MQPIQPEGRKRPVKGHADDEPPGCLALISRVASRPSITGMSTSINTTSGFNSPQSFRALTAATSPYWLTSPLASDTITQSAPPLDIPQISLSESQFDNNVDLITVTLNDPKPPERPRIFTHSSSPSAPIPRRAIFCLTELLNFHIVFLPVGTRTKKEIHDFSGCSMST